MEYCTKGVISVVLLSTGMRFLGCFFPWVFWAQLSLITNGTGAVLSAFLMFLITSLHISHFGNCTQLTRCHCVHGSPGPMLTQLSCLCSVIGAKYLLFSHRKWSCMRNGRSTENRLILTRSSTSFFFALPRIPVIFQEPLMLSASTLQMQISFNHPPFPDRLLSPYLPKLFS